MSAHSRSDFPKQQPPGEIGLRGLFSAEYVIGGLSFGKKGGIVLPVPPAPVSGRPLKGGASCPLISQKGGRLMNYVTYSDLIQISILVISICSLVIQLRKK